MNKLKLAVALSAASLLAACGSDSDDNNTSQSASYSFPSKLAEGESSVVFTGQAARHLLINELYQFIKSDKFQEGFTDETEALAALNTIYVDGIDPADAGTLYDTDIYGATGTSSTPVSLSIDGFTLEQANFKAVGDVAGGKNLKGKLAGQDNDLAADFIGWEIAAGTESAKPDALLQEWFDVLAERAADNDPDTTYVDETTGIDYQQLVQKFLLGAVTYSQAAEDYMKATKGLVKQNTTGDTYTDLEHQWDEGFGYFGASIDYLSKSDADNKANPAIDSDGNSKIDLLTGEYSFGHSVNANKRDAGSNGATDFSREAMEAFIAGRQLIQDNIGTDPVAGQGYHVQLVEHAETALGAWEKAVAATAVHYINDTISDLNKVGTSEENIPSLAKRWSELKGFALGLQFSPEGVSIISRADLTSIHALIGEAPKFANETEITDYIADLEEARDIFKDAYGFDATVAANW